MTVIELYNLVINKGKCVKVVIVDTNKRVKNYIIRVDDRMIFSIGNRSYVLDYDSVYLTSGMPTYFYYIDNPTSISKNELKKKNTPLDMKEASMKIPITSKELNTAIEETISDKIIRYAEGGDKKIINTILLMGGMNLLVVAGIGYFLYTMLEKIWNFVFEKGDILQSILDMLSSGVGN